MQPLRKRFTQAEVEKLVEAGFFDEQRYELIEGDLIDRMGQSPPHACAIHLLMVWLARLFGFERVRVRFPFEVAQEDQKHSCPEPDVAVQTEINAEYQVRHPRGDELLLVVEVADESVHFDLTVKAALYARAKVSEYWVLDVGHRVLVVHRHPKNGSYGRVIQLAEPEMIALEGRGDHMVTISTLMPAKS